MGFKILSSKEQMAVDDAIAAAKANKPKRQEPKQIAELREALKTLPVGKTLYFPIAKDIKASSKRNNIQKRANELGYANCEVIIHPTDSAVLLIKKVEPDTDKKKSEEDEEGEA